MDNAAAAGLTLTAMAASADLFSRTLPPSYQLAGAPADAGSIALVRRQCSQSALLALGLGIGASLLARSPWPAVGVGATVGWLWWQYDQAAHLDGAKLT